MAIHQDKRGNLKNAINIQSADPREHPHIAPHCRSADRDLQVMTHGVAGLASVAFADRRAPVVDTNSAHTRGDIIHQLGFGSHCTSDMFLL